MSFNCQEPSSARAIIDAMLNKVNSKFASPKQLLHRSERGNMLMMTVMCVILVLFTSIVAFAFYLLLTQQVHQQTVADNVSLSLAKAMNEGDRIGQMNNLTVLNRELVYSSRMMLNATQSQDLTFAAPLAIQLLNEARSSATDINKAQVQQAQIQFAAVKYEVDKYNLNTQNQPLLHLPWWQSYDPRICQVNLGTIENVQSNVEFNQGFYYLKDFDEIDNKFVQKKSNLYFGNINAKLPSPDSDLDFKIAALPAPVQTTISPTRLANSEVFRAKGTVFKDGKYESFKVDQIPSAVQVFSTMKVASAENKGQLLVGSVAACNGALYPQPPPDTSMNMMVPLK